MNFVKVVFWSGVMFGVMFGAFIGFLLPLMLILQPLETEAVERGFAEWVVEPSGKTTWKWREEKQ